MQLLRDILAASSTWWPALAVIAALCVVLWISDWLLRRYQGRLGMQSRVPHQILMLILTMIAIVVVVLMLPLEASTRNQLLGLLGLALTAMITLSSTTFMANAMAGLMLRAVGNFKLGDFIRVGDAFGRVTERGLFHTEIQTEDRDLTTVPNMHLVSQPFTVVRSSGTIVSARLSLGYDVPHSRIETLLNQAAQSSGLQDPFVQVLDLGDFSITYRIAGFLPNVKHLLTARSDLRKRILDSLHEAGVEIVSPTFMNQRVMPSTDVVIPERTRKRPKPVPEKTPEDQMFDKAERAALLESLRAEKSELKSQLESLRDGDAGAAGRVERRLAEIDAELAQAEADEAD